MICYYYINTSFPKNQLMYTSPPFKIPLGELEKHFNFHYFLFEREHTFSKMAISKAKFYYASIHLYTLP